MRRLAVVLALAVAGCHRGPGPALVTSLEGLTLPLLGPPTAALAVRGAVDGVEARVQVDPAAPLSVVSRACRFAPPLLARVTVADPFGPDQTFAVTRVEGLRLGGVQLAPFEAALAEGPGCGVVLGAPQLGAVALVVEPAAGQLRFRPSQPRAAWEAEARRAGATVLVAAREPRHDWPLVGVRVRQGRHRFDGALLLSLRDARSRLFAEAAAAAGLRDAQALLATLPAVDDAPAAALRGLPFDALELAPGLGRREGVLAVEPGAPPHAAQGLLGRDVWGAFALTYDVREGVLVLGPTPGLPSGPTDAAVRRLLARVGAATGAAAEPTEPEPADP